MVELAQFSPPGLALFPAAKMELTNVTHNNYNQKVTSKSASGVFTGMHAFSQNSGKRSTVVQKFTYVTSTFNSTYQI